MKTTFLTTKLIPIITIILCYLLFLSGYFQMIIAAILMIIASVLEYRKDFFKSLGFQKNRFKVKNLLIIAPLFSVAYFLFYFYILIPSVTYFTKQPIDFSVFAPYKGDLPAALGLLGFIWLSAAFSEEIVFRGYLMRQFTKFFSSSKLSIIINILLFGFIFGYIHAYQGITGQIVAGITGMILAIIFHIRKSDLWFNIAIHGFIDTVAVLFMYYGVL